MREMENFFPKVIKRPDSSSVIEKKVRKEKTHLWPCMEVGHKKQGV